MANTPTAAGNATLKPLREGMFKPVSKLDEPAHLIGGRCRDCGETFFPKRAFCAACCSGNQEDIEFKNTGTIDTFTVVYQQLPGSAMVPPYAIVRVALDDGPGVQTVATNCDPASLKIGDRVKLVVHKVMDDPAGTTIVSFMAQPEKRA